MIMRYVGPIYRPPSEADSLLIQATVGCPHNKCTFCRVYKKGPRFRIRPLEEITADLESARRLYGDRVETLFFPAGNTIAMPAEQLAGVCATARSLFPQVRRITVYGSSKYIFRKGPGDLRKLKDSGLSRIHVGLESGDDVVLHRIKKGSRLSEYVMLGIGGKERTREHAEATAEVLNAIAPDYIRLRTFLPKVDTLLLHQIRRGRFQMLSAHDVLKETRWIIEKLEVTSQLLSDHYTNYINVYGRLPEDRERMLTAIDRALQRDEASFRPIYVGTQ
jgi:radical SAM superfamily enzyme YgiQ (UPF0313 family)